MKTTMFMLFVAAAMASQAAAADRVARSVGAHPVVYDDYPESDVVIDVGPDVVLTITGEARTRFEWIENTSDFTNDNDDSISYAAARYNLGFRVDLPRDVAAVIEIQSTSDWGGGEDTSDRAGETLDQLPGVATSGGRGRGVSGGNGVYLYQGYIETAHIGDSVLSMRFGRQELAYGTEFMLGNQDFYDGLSWDSVRGIFEFTDKHRLDIFWAKQLEGNRFPGLNTGDTDLYGAYFSAQTLGGSSVGMDAYAMALQDQQDASGIGGANTSQLTSYWAGLRFFRERETGFHFSAELTYQFGDFENTPGVSTDIAAWAFEGSLGYTWDSPTHPTIKGGITWLTGDDNTPTDTEAFFTPAGEIHPRLGMMDLFNTLNPFFASSGSSLNQNAGLHAYTLGYSGSKDNHSWGADLWYFETDEDVFITPLIREDELGQEVDLWYNYQYSEHMVAQFAVAYFNAGNITEEENKLAPVVTTDDAWRVYANLMVRF